MYLRCLAYITLFCFSSCRENDELISPERRDITESVYAFGVIESRGQYEVFANTPAVIEEIYVTEGQHMKKGEILFKLENDAGLLTESARLAAANARLSANRGQLQAAENEIRLAEKKMRSDSLLFQRQRNLWAQQIGSKVDLEKTELNFDNSKVALLAARVNYANLQRQLKFQDDLRQNELALARTREKDFIIRSEIEGTVFKINVRPGENASVIEPLAIIGGDDFVILLNIDEADIVKIQRGQQVFVKLDSYKDKVYEATVMSVSPLMNSKTRTFEVEAVFKNKPEVLYPNLTLEANIVVDQRNDVLTIPRKYLLSDSTVLLEDGTLQRVQTGLMDYNLVEIKNGLSTESRIALPGK